MISGILPGEATIGKSVETVESLDTRVAGKDIQSILRPEEWQQYVDVYEGKSQEGTIMYTKDVATNESYDGPPEQLQPRTEYNIDGNTIVTDDFGKPYKRNGELIPLNEYTLDGNTYYTDDKGRIYATDFSPELGPKSDRDLKAQKESGGEDRLEDDQGGHIVAHNHGGANDTGNMVAQRGTVNQGDYKRVENDVTKALEEGAEVESEAEIEYKGKSTRPDVMRVNHHIETEEGTREISGVFENRENSTRLLSEVKEKIPENEYKAFAKELREWKKESDISITSVVEDVSANGDKQVRVGILDEKTGEKTYRVFTVPKEAAA